MYKPFFLQRLLGSLSSRPGMPSRAAVRSARRAASICHDLLSQRGEVSGALIAREALSAYQSLEGQALEAFFSFLVKEFSLDPEAVVRYAAAYGPAFAAPGRCYAFFHPALPDEPVIFIEVALARGMSAKVQPLLAPDSPVVDPASADCAIFYSITNPQEGLRGISFGNLLIKQVAEDLGREFPRLKTFATLSPIPGFRKWLAGGTGLREGDPRHAELAALLAKLDVPDWFKDKARAAEILKQLTRLCAHYLLYAKQDDEPLDAVARFHLGNGARLERLNWLGDTSATGMRRSAGLMVNYVYRLDDVERNHEAYATGNRIIASRRFGVLAKESLLVRGGTPRRTVTA